MSIQIDELNEIDAQGFLVLRNSKNIDIRLYHKSSVTDLITFLKKCRSIQIPRLM